MINDPIVEEIHNIRKNILHEYEGNIQKYMDHLKSRELKDKSKIKSFIEKDRYTKAK
ncbi:MAG: hypothetical protein MRK02_03970 [Candidatus Scalindua sp.]|nr:hypothetical protein [Candidatus Scalindua sp.]